jgi:hypothetical protein
MANAVLLANPRLRGSGNRLLSSTPGRFRPDLASEAIGSTLHHTVAFVARRTLWSQLWWIASVGVARPRRLPAKAGLRGT